ncbi:MAG: ABC transporter permease [Devosia sp.]|nr:ABC transporter permease [Devosia sp.]
MSALQKAIAIIASGACLAALLLPFATRTGAPAGIVEFPLAAAFLVAGLLSIARFRVPVSLWLDGVLAFAGAVVLLVSLSVIGKAEAGFWFALVAAWAFSWLLVERLSHAIGRGVVLNTLGLVIPLMFGASILVIWEAATRAGGVPPILLPAPSLIWARIVSSLPTLWADFQQTFLKAVLAGYFIGCGAGFLVAIAIDRSPFLKRGLLPLGNFVSALPIVGVAPILVMWFGFDWPSKAAVVVVMTFFPMLVNTVAGLNAAGGMERDMMRTYAAGYWQTLFKLRLPAAAPFIFNALKINSTLALIGAIVAEFFGTPIVGMGFRISTEVGRMNVDMVWAEIAVAALAGSLFYGVVVLIERAVTFWHPSVRGGRA